MIGIGVLEVIILGVIAMVTLGIPIAIIVFVLFMVRRPNDTQSLSTIRELQEENQRLREELTNERAGHA
jgi:hypothetical protein